MSPGFASGALHILCEKSDAPLVAPAAPQTEGLANLMQQMIRFNVFLQGQTLCEIKRMQLGERS
jgi:hypothetical protein